MSGAAPVPSTPERDVSPVQVDSPTLRPPGYGGQADASRPQPRSRAGLGVTLALGMGIPPLVIYALSALSPLIVADLGLSRAQFGSFASFSFAVAAPFSAAGGRAADRLGGRRVLLVLFTAATGALLAAAAAPSYAWLLVAVAVSGFAQSLSNPVTNQLISAHVPAGRQGLLVGVKQSGVQLSQFAAGLTLPAVAVAVGWREAIAATSGIALASLLVTWRYVPAGAALSAGRRAGAGLRDLPEVVWWLAAYALLMGLSLQATNVYLPLYGFERLGLGVTTAGLTAAVAGAVGVVARIAWGRLTEGVTAPYVSLASMAAAAGVAVTLLLCADLADAPGLVWVGAVVHGLTALAANAVVMVVLLERVDRAVAGIATGVLAIGLYAGFAAGPITFGAVVDATGSYVVGWSTAVLAYAAAALLMLAWRRRTRSEQAVGAAAASSRALPEARTP